MTVSSSLKTVGIDHVVLHVSDMERSKDFYVGLLGMSVAHEGGGHTFLHCRSAGRGPVPGARRKAPGGRRGHEPPRATPRLRRARGGGGRAGGARLHRLRPLRRPQLHLLQRPRRPSPAAPAPRRALGPPWDAQGERARPGGSAAHSVDALTQQFRALGVQPGGLLQVHTAFSKVGPVEGGPLGLIAALRAALGDGGTLVMPSMASDDDHVFDPRTSPCTGMGRRRRDLLADARCLRSDNAHAFAAVGPLASRIVAPHSLSLPHGLDSPVGRVYELDGHVLLLGIDHTSDTTIHLAEHLAGVRYRRPKHLTVLRDGAPSRFEYGEIDHCCKRFCAGRRLAGRSRPAASRGRRTRGGAPRARRSR